MKSIVLVVLILIGSTYISAYDIRDAKRDATILRDVLNHAQKFIQRGNSITEEHHLGDMSVECALCGIVVNEIEGLMAENTSETAIIDSIEKGVCAYFGGDTRARCDDLVGWIPDLITRIENRDTVGVICVEYNYCSVPFTVGPDPIPITKFVVDLDMKPSERWNHICSIPHYQKNTQYLVNVVNSLLPGHGKMINDLGIYINNNHLPTEFAQEIAGCATNLGIELGWATWFNLGYEITDACTSIVAQGLDGKIYHARNLDFWAGMGFTDTLKNISMQVEFTKGGQTQYFTTGFAGYVGALSGMRPNGFSITIDTRMHRGSIGDLFQEVMDALTDKNASLVTFLSRHVLAEEHDFQAAIKNLANGELITWVYYTVGGVSADEGAVISRNQHNATDIWMLDLPTRWFEVETNYDHWKPTPWFDDRRKPANDMMNALGQSGVSLDNMFKVISTKPVLNLQTTYSILACAADGSYTSYARNCKYPCTE